VKKLLLVAILVAAGLLVRGRFGARDEEELWTQATRAADLR
jgi:hypothetical protein